ncbi:hypothetical protein F4859DRAFT_403062 [Xylaria cf. heliscus]|nr:hypothetical protein F4859DRAFT_403062 [Xylaria cf. heliscus]
MSPVAHSGPAVPPSNKTMVPEARNNSAGAAGKRSVGSVPHSGSSGSGKAPFRHIDDIVSVNVDLDPHTPLRKVIEVGDKHMQQAITYKAFGRFDLALQEYIKAFTIAVDKVPKHKEYPSLRSDRGDLSRSYNALKVKITKNGVAYDGIKEVIKEDNLRSGVCPEKLVAKSPQALLPDLPSVPSNPPSQQSADNRDVHPRASFSNGQSLRPNSQIYDGYGPERKTKPIIHPKPQALHGNSIRPTLDKPSPDLVARFAKLRDPLESRNNYSPPPLTKPTGPRSMPLPNRLPLSVHSSLPAMPKVPDAIYSPARGTVTSEAANLPSSTPRGMFSRTNSIVSMSGTSSRTSMENVLKTINGEQFVTAHTYGDTQASSRRNAHIPEGDLITVKELLRCMEDASSSANIKILLIDVRDRQLFDEGHITSQSTICLDPPILSRQNISANEIVDSMILAPASEKLLFERRDEVDLIVFYDQDSESIPQRITNNIKEAVIFNLQQALIHYSFPKQLNHTPKLLVGGIDAWVDEMGQLSLQTSKTQSIPTHVTSTSASTRERLRNRTLKPEEVNTFEAMIGRDETGDFDYAKSRDDFMRRFPSLREPESMVSNEQDGSSAQSVGSGSEEFLKDMTPVPPIRPKPSVARTRYSGLESADEHSPPSGLAMMATASANSPKNSIPTGLINPGNWCYANATVQALLVCRRFVDEFLDPQWPTKYRPNIVVSDPAHNQLMCRILGNLFQWLSQRSFRSMKASTLMHYLRTIHSGYTINSGQTVRFGDNSQHDSDELITFIFGQLECEAHVRLTKNLLPPLDTTTATGFVVNRWANRRNQTIISRYWYYVELHTFTCNNCKAKNFVAEESERYQFPVAANDNSGTLDGVIKQHFQDEGVESTCDRCLSRGKVLKRQIARVPPFLRIGLQRTDQTSSLKVTSHMQFPIDTLRLTNYVLEPEERAQIAELLGGEAADGFNSTPCYDLFAVVAHAGQNLNSGHYICYIRNDNNTWTQCNDTTITPNIPPNTAANKLYTCKENFTPVQLYYRRIEGPCPPEKTK